MNALPTATRLNTPHPSDSAGNPQGERRVIRSTSNAILGLLTPDELSQLDPVLTRVGLSPGQALIKASAPLEYVFFVEKGFATLLADMGGANPRQLAMVDRGGGVGLLELVTNSPTAFATVFLPVSAIALRALVQDIAGAVADIPSLRGCSTTICSGVARTVD